MENIARRKAEKANELNKNLSDKEAPEIKLKNSNTKKEITEKQLDTLAKGRQKRTQNSTIKNNKSKKENKENINKAEKEKKSLIKRIIKNKEKLKFLKKAKRELIDECVKKLILAKDIHDKLEEYYINATDFGVINDIGDKILKNI